MCFLRRGLVFVLLREDHHLPIFCGLVLSLFLRNLSPPRSAAESPRSRAVCTWKSSGTWAEEISLSWISLKFNWTANNSLILKKVFRSYQNFAKTLLASHRTADSLLKKRKELFPVCSGIFVAEHTSRHIIWSKRLQFFQWLLWGKC